ncbi:MULTISPECIES: hypothetical protein [Bacillales]|uniref:rolling circle replication-associated protein n=1 Tax=Bacillales TaxID=1385 RepID=UPI0018C38FCF|nr:MULTISPECIES: hypothetical protein [Bacillales]MBG0918990.1 Rep protein [Exiguobacterium sp. SRB7LM]MBG0967070.1 Rep protein [Bacillus sp. SRB1LM]
MSGALLDLGKNNSTDAENVENDRYDCTGAFDDMYFEGPEGETAPYRCDSWDCYTCGYRMRQNLIEEIQRITAERSELSRILTLTLDPAKAPDNQERQHHHITDRWNALRTRLKREIGDFSFIWVREEQESGLPHIHALVSRYLPQKVVSEAWGELGGGEIVDIRAIDDVRKAAHYVGKYLTKDALTGLPDGIRRYGSSADLDLGVRGGNDSESDWRLLKEDKITGVPRAVVRADFVRNDAEGGLDPPLGG